jgi:hypothetical protein
VSVTSDVFISPQASRPRCPVNKLLRGPVDVWLCQTAVNTVLVVHFNGLVLDNPAVMRHIFLRYPKSVYYYVSVPKVVPDSWFQ